MTNDYGRAIRANDKVAARISRFPLGDHAIRDDDDDLSDLKIYALLNEISRMQRTSS